MVLLKDILNQDNNTDHTSKSPDTSGGNLSDSPQLQPSAIRRKSNGNLPSPSFSMSSNVSSNGNSDNDAFYDEGTRRSSFNGPTESHMNTPQSDTSSSAEEEHLTCHWDHCGQVFTQPEFLYHHLCKDHVGRKSQKNLQLNCKWENCHARTEKRDHITSHLRVHVPLKPFNCSKCGKNFKRPQDLKKHLKIHIESHIIIKKKRGPKMGSKRVTKKSKEESTSNVQGENLAPSPLNHSVQPAIQPTLPPISLQQLITSELSSYEPIYTQQLGARLQTVLPPISSDDNLPRTSPMATTNAAYFFSALSKNMAGVMPAQHGIQQPQVSQSFSTYDGSMNVNNALGNTNINQNSHGASFGPRSYPAIRSLPPIEPAFAPQDRTSILPSLSSVPVLTPRYKTFERAPNFNIQGQYFSTKQRSNGKQEIDQDQELISKLASLNVGEDESEAENYLEAFETVNMMKDYLFCLLLEDEYEAEDENDDVLSRVRVRPKMKLSRYPQLVI